MKFRAPFFLFLLIAPLLGHSAIHVGVASVDITPPVGTPSAGYMERKGEGMEGVLDPLLAIALFLDNGEKKIVLCSVDHLGFTHEMVQDVREIVQQKVADCEVHIGSSHTHSGGGSYLNIPYLGESLAGVYNAEIKKQTIQKTAQAIMAAVQTAIPAKVGIGFGQAANLSKYRASWPEGVTPLSAVTVWKITKIDNTPLAVFFNYPVHPTVLKASNRLFSADFVGVARNELQTTLGAQPLYFNGAQGDLIPNLDSCEAMGTSLAQTVKSIWDQIETSETLDITTEKLAYQFEPKATPFGLVFPVKRYETEMNLLVLNQKHACITIPGELSCVYDRSLKKLGDSLGYASVSIFGLTDDAHGYIILPEAWSHKTSESKLSFAGENYGHLVESQAVDLLTKHRVNQPIVNKAAP